MCRTARPVDWLLALVFAALAVLVHCSRASTAEPIATPAATASDWREAPAVAERRALAQAQATADHKPTGFPWGKVGTAVLTALGVAFGVAKTVSGTNPLARLTTTVGQFTYNLIAHRDAKHDDQLATAVVDVLHEVGPAIDYATRSRIACRLVQRLPVPALPAAQSLLDRLNTESPPPSA